MNESAIRTTGTAPAPKCTMGAISVRCLRLIVLKHASCTSPVVFLRSSRSPAAPASCAGVLLSGIPENEYALKVETTLDETADSTGVRARAAQVQPKRTAESAICRSTQPATDIATNAADVASITPTAPEAAIAAARATIHSAEQIASRKAIGEYEPTRREGGGRRKRRRERARKDGEAQLLQFTLQRETKHEGWGETVGMRD